MRCALPVFIGCLFTASVAQAGYLMPTSFLVDAYAAPLTIPPTESAAVSLRVNDVTWHAGTFTAADTHSPRKILSVTKDTATFDWDRMSDYFVAGPVVVHCRIDAGSLVATYSLPYPAPGWPYWPPRERLTELRFLPEAFVVDTPVDGYLAGTFRMTLELVPEPGAVALALSALAAVGFTRRRGRSTFPRSWPG